MTAALLDTSVVIKHSVLPVGEYAISAVTLAELHFGLHAVNDNELRGTRIAKLALIENTFDAIPFDSAAGREYGRLAGAITARGGNPRRRAFDIAIAATANVHDLELVTLNPGDFSLIDDLVRVRS